MEANKQLIGQLNLLPSEMLRQQRLDKIRKQTSCFFMLIIVLLFPIKIQFQHKVDQLQKELATMKPPTSQVRAFQIEAETLRAKLEHEEKRQHMLNNQKRLNPASDLSQIETITPADIRVLRVNLNLDNLSVTGQATRPQDIAYFLEELQQCYGDNIRLSTCQLKDDHRYYFQIEGEKTP